MRNRRLARKAATAWRLPIEEKLWCLFLVPCSAAVRLAIWALPFKRVAVFLGSSIRGEQQLFWSVTESQEARGRRIGKMGRLVARYTPWETKCLAQAIMVRMLLGWYDIPCVIRIGVMKSEEPDDPLKAHAWVEVGDSVIVGRAGYERFTVLHSYASRCSLVEPLPETERAVK